MDCSNNNYSQLLQNHQYFGADKCRNVSFSSLHVVMTDVAVFLIKSNNYSSPSSEVNCTPNISEVVSVINTFKSSKSVSSPLELYDKLSIKRKNRTSHNLCAQHLMESNHSYLLKVSRALWRTALEMKVC